MAVSMLYQIDLQMKNSVDYLENLVVRAQGGDREAFALIFDEYYSFIYKFIYAMLGDRSLAEELTQETFLGAYKNIYSLRGEAKLPTWLCAIAKNKVYKSFRSRRHEGIKIDDEMESLNLPDEKNPTPEKQFLDKELKSHIQIALGKLTEDKRLVFTLKEIQNLSYKEISEITGYAIPKLKTDLSRAKAEMRKLLRFFQEVKK